MSSTDIKNFVNEWTRLKSLVPEPMLWDNEDKKRVFNLFQAAVTAWTAPHSACSPFKVARYIAAKVDQEPTQCVYTLVYAPQEITYPTGRYSQFRCSPTVVEETEECEYCQDNFHREQITTAGRTENLRVCAHCLQENFTWEGDFDRFITNEEYEEYHEDDEDDGDYGDDNEGDDSLKNYDYNPARNMTKDTFRTATLEKLSPEAREKEIFMGVELEVLPIDRDQYRTARDTIYKVIKSFAVLKYDGSISDALGFEIATVPGTLKFHREAWQPFFEVAPKHVRSWNARTSCGIHVHLDREALGPLVAGRLIAFIHAKENRDFIYDIAGRSTHFAMLMPDTKITTLVSKRGYHHRDHYDAAGPSDRRKTVEIRIFRGNITKNGLMRCVEFCHALASFCRQTSNRKLQAADFFDWFAIPGNRKQYPELEQWMLRKGYIKLKKRLLEETPNR